MRKRWRNRKRWAARRARIEQDRKELFFADLTATFRGRLSVIEAQIHFAWEQSGLDRLLEGLERAA